MGHFPFIVTLALFARQLVTEEKGELRGRGGSSSKPKNVFKSI